MDEGAIFSIGWKPIDLYFAKLNFSAIDNNNLYYNCTVTPLGHNCIHSDHSELQNILGSWKPVKVAQLYRITNVRRSSRLCQDSTKRTPRNSFFLFPSPAMKRVKNNWRLHSHKVVFPHSLHSWLIGNTDASGFWWIFFLWIRRKHKSSYKENIDFVPELPSFGKCYM